MPDPLATQVRHAAEELETIAFMLRAIEDFRTGAGLVLAGPAFARMLEGTARRLLDCLPPVPRSAR